MRNARKNTINVIFTEGRVGIKIRGVLLRQLALIRCQFAGQVETRFRFCPFFRVRLLLCCRWFPLKELVRSYWRLIFVGDLQLCLLQVQARDMLPHSSPLSRRNDAIFLYTYPTSHRLAISFASIPSQTPSMQISQIPKHHTHLLISITSIIRRLPRISAS